jgi:hypothetical protein
MSRLARVTENPHNIGNGVWEVGLVFEVVAETACYYTLCGGSRINKKHLSIAGTACGRHSVKVEILTGCHCAAIFMQKE